MIHAGLLREGGCAIAHVTRKIRARAELTRSVLRKKKTIILRDRPAQALCLQEPGATRHECQLERRRERRKPRYRRGAPLISIIAQRGIDARSLDAASARRDPRPTRAFVVATNVTPVIAEPLRARSRCLVAYVCVGVHTCASAREYRIRLPALCPACPSMPRAHWCTLRAATHEVVRSGPNRHGPRGAHYYFVKGETQTVSVAVSC